MAECLIVQYMGIGPCHALLPSPSMVSAVTRACSLFVPTLFILANYGGLVVRGTVDDQTRVWTIVLTEYVFMAGAMITEHVYIADAMFVFNATDVACPSNYTYISQYDN